MSGNLKLAVRNVRRQFENYLIYFLTVALTVALLFAVNNVFFGKELAQHIDMTSDFKNGMKALIVLIALIVSFVLGYATSFMLKLRKREFGTYLTLGMSRNNLLAIFLAETLVICVTALGVGIFFGLFIYQGFMAVIMRFMDMEFLISSYSVRGLVFTIVLVAAIFLLACGASAFYLKKVRIYQLVYQEKKVARASRVPFLWFLLALVSFGLIVYSCFAFENEIEQVFADREASSAFVEIFSVFACGVVVFHISISKSVVSLLLKRRRLRAKGTNTFVLRQLSGALGTNALMIGLLAVLLTFAVIGVNVSFVQRASELALLDRDYPFDLLCCQEDAQYNKKPDQAVLREAEQIVQKHTAVTQTFSYPIYRSGASDLYGYTKWSGAGYEGLMDSYMTESDFNAVMTFLGKEPITLDGEFYIVANNAAAAQAAWQEAVLNRNGRKYRIKGVREDVPVLHYVYFYAVIPDEAAKGMELETFYTAYRFSNTNFHAPDLNEQLDELEGKNEYCNFLLREYGRYERNSVAAILTVGALFVALVFLMLAMAVLALKTLSGIAQDREKYRILFQLGAGERQRCRALFRQTSCFFFLPFSGAVLVSIPTGWICGKVVILGGTGVLAAETYVTAAVVALVMAAVGIVYYMLTYLIAKRTVI